MSATASTQPPATEFSGTLIWPERFAGRVILVTGAAGGLGSAARTRLEAEGATVIATDVVSSDTSQTGIIPLDVRSREAWTDVVTTAIEENGHIDGALFCHGVQGPEFTVADMPIDGWARCIDINLTGCFHGLAVVLPHLTKQNYGRVAVLSSIAAREGNPNQAAYSCSKAAVIALVKTSAKETATYGVTVNAVAPSMFETPLLKDLSPERNAQLLARVPMGRIGQPAEFAGLAAWLLSPESSYMTGQTLDLSGGRNTA